MHYYTASNDNELYHYGVLGMKWGVRKGNIEGATEKASKKLVKLDKKASRAQKKAAKARYSPDSAKYLKRQNDADRKIMKAAQWYNSMESVLGKKQIENITNSRNVNLAKKYTKYLSNLHMLSLQTEFSE